MNVGKIGSLRRQQMMETQKKDVKMCLKCIEKNMIYIYIFKDFIYLFLERGRERGRERGKHQCVVASCATLLGTWPATQACVLDWESNQ